MDDFLQKFFPKVYVKKHEVKEDNYCKFDDQGLQLFTSSLYLAALMSSFLASKTCKSYGRKMTMQARWCVCPPPSTVSASSAEKGR